MAFFSDLLKKWFYTNSSAAASSDARIPLLTATGEPKGSDTMAGISNLIGALPVNNANLDDVKHINRAGFYLAQGNNCANKPEEGSMYWAIIAFKTNSATFWPLLAFAADNTKFYVGLLTGSTLYWHKVAFSS